MDENLHTLSLDSLAGFCAQQTSRFYQGRENDTSFCFEIFRRAILEQDQQAWEFIHQVYYDQIIRWVHRHPAFVSTGEDAEYFLNRTLEKFWQAVTPEKFHQFPDLKHLLSYFQLCVHSTIMDYVRARAKTELEIEFSQAEKLAGPILLEDCIQRKSQAQSLWKLVTGRLNDLKEVQVAYDSFVLDMKPAEMFERSPGSYENIKEIYRIKENVIERLRRDVELMKLLGFQAESVE
jgi:hypothetical protein